MIEEFLDGEEASFFALVDGEKVVPLIAAQVCAGLVQDDGTGMQEEKRLPGRRENCAPD